jgi:hypothetical protein
MTNEGELVWYVETAVPQTNLFAQQLDGKPVLTRWHGKGSKNGHGYGSVIILDDKYTPINEICPKPNFVTSDDEEPECYADLHESFITDQGTILVTAVNMTQADLISVGGLVDGWILDNWIFEIDIKTNEIVFSWSALEAGIPLNLSKVSIASNVMGNGTARSSAGIGFT